MPTKCTAIVLAAGKSSRMGVPKGLLKYKHTFWLLEQINRISQTNIKQVLIVLGHHKEDYLKTIPWLSKALHSSYSYGTIKLRVCINSNPEAGSFSSLQTGLQRVTNTHRVVICPIDVPFFPSTLSLLLSHRNNVIIPTFEHKKGHPVILSTKFWNLLLAINPHSKQARLDTQIKLLPINQISQIEVNDALVIKNINCPNEWKDYLTTYS